MSKYILPRHSSKSFIVSGLTFSSLKHFEFIFMYGVRKCANFILLHVTVQFSQHYLLTVKRVQRKRSELGSQARKGKFIRGERDGDWPLRGTQHPPFLMESFLYQ